jgi:hypothetical protein
LLHCKLSPALGPRANSNKKLEAFAIQALSVTDALCGGFRATQPAKSVKFRQHMTILVLAWGTDTKKNVVEILSLWSKFLAGKY